MVKTAKELAEMFAKMSPDDLVWAYWYARDEVEISNDPDGTGNKGVKDEDWEVIVKDIGDVPEQIYEQFSEATRHQLGQYQCDGCYEYDYSAVENGDLETMCRYCGEETDIVS